MAGTTAGRWLKRIVLAVVVVAVLLVAAAVAALMLIDTEALKGQVERRVQAATGRELQIEGPLEISIFPWIGFEIGNARLANAPGFEERSFVAFDHAELRARILPLLRREVVLDTVVLHGARVNAARNAQGETNWADLVAPEGAPTEPPPGETPEPPPETPDAAPPPEDGAPLRLRIDGIELRDARLSWRDAVNDRVLVLGGLELTTGTLEPNRATPVELAGTLTNEAGLTIALEVATDLTYDPEAPSVTLADLTVDVTGEGETLPAGATARLQADVNVDVGAGTAAVEPLTIEALDTLSAEGAVATRFGGDTPQFNGRLAVAPFSPKALAEAGGWPLPPRSDESTLEQASLSLQFSGTPDAVTVEPLEARLDDTRLTGNARAQLGDIPVVDFTLQADGLDVDRYLPDPAAANGNGGQGEGETAPAPEAQDPIAGLPLDALHGVGAQGRVTVGRLQWRGIPMDDVRLEANLADGVLDLTRADLRVAGGRITASGRLDASDTASPAAEVQADVADVQSQPLLAAFLDSAPVTGRLNANATLSTAGATLDAWTGALDGDFATTFSDGAIHGLNIAQRLRVAAARLRGDEPDQAAETRQTDFSTLKISATIQDGVVRSNDLDLRSPLLRVGGEGQVDLAKETIDYTARILVTGTLEGQGGAERAALSGAELPLHLTGSLTSPSIELGISDALEQRAQEQLEATEEELEQKAQEAEERARDEIEKEVDEAGERIEDEIKKGLEGMFE